MKAVVQRVSSASISSGNEKLCEIGCGAVVLLGVEKGDTHQEASWMANKITTLRIFEDEAQKLNKDILDSEGELMLVSNFTVAGNAAKGRRPSFDNAASFEIGKELFEACADICRKANINVATGVYGADMQVSLTNDGPVTIILSTR